MKKPKAVLLALAAGVIAMTSASCKNALAEKNDANAEAAVAENAEGAGGTTGGAEIMPGKAEDSGSGSVVAGAADAVPGITGEIFVNGDLVKEPLASFGSSQTSGIPMVPLNEVAKKLDISVDYDKTDGNIIVHAKGFEVYMTVGKELYTIDGNEPVDFSPAPEVIGGYVYVPMTFFSNAVEGYSVILQDGQISIDQAGN